MTTKIDTIREILINLNNTQPTLEEFFELLEKETQGKLTFTKFKKLLESKYPTISKSKLYY